MICERCDGYGHIEDVGQYHKICPMCRGCGIESTDLEYLADLVEEAGYEGTVGRIDPLS